MEFYRFKSEELPRIHFVDEVEISPPYVHRKRCAGEYIMYVIQQGEMYLVEDGMPLNLSKGDVCILDKDRIHQGTRASNCRYYYIHFQSSSIERIAPGCQEQMIELLLCKREKSLKDNPSSYELCQDQDILIPKHCHISNTNEWIELSAILQQAIHTHYDQLENYKILTACEILKAMIKISRCYLTKEYSCYIPKLPPYYPKVQKILEWLNREYARDITSAILEETFLGNFDYLNRSFKKITGDTIFSYLTKVRIGHAKILILHTSLRIKEVGIKVGYADEYYFSRVFRKHVGMPPAEYARLVLKEK